MNNSVSVIPCSSIGKFMEKLKLIIEGINYCILKSDQLDTILKLITNKIIVSSEERTKLKKIISKMKIAQQQGIIDKNKEQDIRNWIGSIVKGDYKDKLSITQKPNRRYPMGQKIFLSTYFVSKYESKLILFLEIERKLNPSDINRVIQGLKPMPKVTHEVKNIISIRFEINLNNNKEITKKK